jgi:hypothetical protein
LSVSAGRVAAARRRRGWQDAISLGKHRVPGSETAMAPPLLQRKNALRSMTTGAPSHCREPLFISDPTLFREGDIF